MTIAGGDECVDADVERRAQRADGRAAAQAGGRPPRAGQDTAARAPAAVTARTVTHVKRMVDYGALK